MWRINENFISQSLRHIIKNKLKSCISNAQIFRRLCKGSAVSLHPLTEQRLSLTILLLGLLMMKMHIKGHLKENCDAITIFQISNLSVSEGYRIINGLNWWVSFEFWFWQYFDSPFHDTFKCSLRRRFAIIYFTFFHYIRIYIFFFFFFLKCCLLLQMFSHIFYYLLIKYYIIIKQETRNLIHTWPNITDWFVIFNQFLLMLPRLLKVIVAISAKTQR